MTVTRAPAEQPLSRAWSQVGEFHRVYGLPINAEPTVEVGSDQVALRQALIEEEVAELAAAARAGDLTGIADALADIVYVAYGTAHVYGIDLDAVLDEVHASNMTKLDENGRPVRRRMAATSGGRYPGPLSTLPSARRTGRPFSSSLVMFEA